VEFPDLIRLFIGPLERLGIRYFVTGGVATVVYGEPRFTRDIDVVIALEPSEGARLRESFDPTEFYVPPAETLLEESTRPTGGHFNLIHARTALRADVYVTAGDPLEAWAFEHRGRLDLEGLQIWIAPIEYVLVRKLEYFGRSGSERHLRDAATMLRVSADAIDREALGAWVARRGLDPELDAAESYPL